MTPSISSTLIWTVIIGMAVSNFSMRYIPMAVLSRIQLPDPIMRWLSFIPISVMGSLFAKQILLPAFDAAPATPLYFNPGIFGGLAAMIGYRMTKSFIGSTLIGVGIYLAMRWVVGI